MPNAYLLHSFYFKTNTLKIEFEHYAALASIKFIAERVRAILKLPI